MGRARSRVSGCEPISRLDRCREHVRATDALRFYCYTTIASMSIEFMFVLLVQRDVCGGESERQIHRNYYQLLSRYYRRVAARIYEIVRMLLDA
jgi:hypothetical protein